MWCSRSESSRTWQNISLGTVSDSTQTSLFHNLQVLQLIHEYLLFNCNLTPTGPARIQPKPELYMQNVIESCPFKSVMSFVVGGGLGAFMGLFSSSIAPHHTRQVENIKYKHWILISKVVLLTDGYKRDIDRYEEHNCQQCERICIYWFCLCR